MIGVEEARREILNAVSPLGLEKVDLASALGRVIGESVSAGHDIPPQANSAMDGCALRAADTHGASPESPVPLQIVEEIPAGTMPHKTIGAGQAAVIMTGAPIPAGTDAVVRREDTLREGTRVSILVEAKTGQDIRRAGADVRRGEKVISRGEIVRPAEVGILAALGRASILVHKRPLIAIVATGDELEEITESPSPGKVVSSNSYALAALVHTCGAIPLQIGIARDTREDLAAKFSAAMRADLIASTGGVSMGDYDLVKEVMKDAGNRMHFWQVAMTPGRPLAFGMLGTVPLVALPGNPAASVVCFEQFIRPAIRKMLGHANLFRRAIRARLDEGIKKKAGMRHFFWARVRREGETYAAITTGAQSSGILLSMVRANGLLILPEDATVVEAGEEVTVELLDDSLEWTSREC
jgi:molybdopterin molybdotransferase